MTTYTQPHECCKKDCYFCYEMNRKWHKVMELTMPVKKQKVKLRSFPARRWSGCDNLKMIANIHLQSKALSLIFPDRSWYSLKSRLSQFRREYPAYRLKVYL